MKASGGTTKRSDNEGAEKKAHDECKISAVHNISAEC